MSRPRRDYSSWIFLVAALLLIILASLDTSQPAQQAERTSSYFSDDAGTRGAYLVLKHFLEATQRWRYPLTRLAAQDGTTSTLLVLAPAAPISEVEADALDGWIEQGNQLIIATGLDWPVGTGSLLEDLISKEKEPDYLERHNLTIGPWREDEIRQESASGLVTNRIALAYRKDEPVGAVAEVSVGLGRLILVADSRVFSNETIKQHPQNMSWLVERVARQGGAIYIDEFHHGFGSERGFWVLLWRFLQTPWGWACLQAMLAGALYLLVTRSRFGDIRDAIPPSPRSPVALIEARSALFQRTGKRRLASSLIDQYLQFRNRRERPFSAGQNRTAVEESYREKMDSIRREGATEPTRQAFVSLARSAAQLTDRERTT